MPPSVVQRADPPKQAPRVVGGFGYKKTAVKRPGNKPDGAPSDQVTPQAVTASDWKRRWREEKRRADVLHSQLAKVREQCNDAEKARDELQGSLERAKSAVRFERHRAQSAKGSVLPKRAAKVVSRASPEPPRSVKKASAKKAPATKKVAAVRPATPGSWESEESETTTRPCSCATTRTMIPTTACPCFYGRTTRSTRPCGGTTTTFLN